MKNKKIAYLCDGKACGSPPPDDCGKYCRHTTDIKHAKYFYDRGDGCYMEFLTIDPEAPQLPTQIIPE